MKHGRSVAHHPVRRNPCPVKTAAAAGAGAGALPWRTAPATGRYASSTPARTRGAAARRGSCRRGRRTPAETAAGRRGRAGARPRTSRVAMLPSSTASPRRPSLVLERPHVALERLANRGSRTSTGTCPRRARLGRGDDLLRVERARARRDHQRARRAGQPAKPARIGELAAEVEAAREGNTLAEHRPAAWNSCAISKPARGLSNSPMRSPPPGQARGGRRAAGRLPVRTREVSYPADRGSTTRITARRPETTVRSVTIRWTTLADEIHSKRHRTPGRRRPVKRVLARQPDPAPRSGGRTARPRATRENLR